MKLRIGIEAQRIFRPKKHGMDIVALELIRNLQEIDTQNEYFIFVKPDSDNQIIKETNNFKIISINFGPYPLWEQIALPYIARKFNLDVLHCTSNTAPLIKCAKSLVVTLHDIIYLEKVNLSKGTMYQIIGNLYRRWNVPKMLEKANQIITVSDFEKDRINNHFNLKPGKVHTIYNSAGEHFKKSFSKDEISNFRIKYNLPENYVLFLGNTDPKKNVIGVLSALAILFKENKIKNKLVMLDINRDYFHKILTEVNCPELEKHITFSGYIPNAEMPALYAGANYFLYPSLRESFGIPILEAMSCGLPVITSETSSMPEVAANAALYCNPFVPETIADAMHKMNTDLTLHAILSQRSKERASEFSWKTNAIQTLDLYNKIVDKQQKI